MCQTEPPKQADTSPGILLRGIHAGGVHEQTVWSLQWKLWSRCSGVSGRHCHVVQGHPSSDALCKVHNQPAVSTRVAERENYSQTGRMVNGRLHETSDALQVWLVMQPSAYLRLL